MMVRRSVFLLTLMVLTGAVVFAQTAESGATVRETLTIDDLYLSQEVEIQLLRSQALATSRESKLLALQDIGAMVENGQIDADNKEILSILDSLAGEGVYRVVTTNGAVTNNYPEVRREAVRLLGRIGGVTANATLIKVLSSDKETMVQSEAVYALGLTASKDNSQTLPYVAQLLHTNNQRANPDANLTFAALLSIEKMAAAQGGIADPEVINAVLDVAYAGRYPKNVALKAFSVLGKMRAR